MTTNKKSNLSHKGRKKNETGTIIGLLILIILCITGLYLYKTKDNLLVGNITYYTGDIYSANHAANMLDYLDKGNNIVVSPINVNTSLAILYNGTDNNSHKELKRYFKRTPREVNEEMQKKLSTLNAINKTKNKFNNLYETYISELNGKSYNTLTLSTISLLPQEEKENLILLLRKIQLSYEVITNNRDLTEKNIKEYKLTSSELSYNNYNIKELLDEILSNYEHYNITNEVNNYTGIYINNFNENSIDNSFINDTSIYNYNLKSLNHDSDTEKVQAINDDIKTITSGGISRIVDDHSIGSSDIIITNNLHFNYSWEKPFNYKHVKDAEFYNIDNEVQAVEMMYASQNTYLENSKAKGFKYDFENGKYSFVGILPKKVEDFKLSTLNLDSLLLSKKQGNVLIGIPKMTYQSEIDIEKLVSNYKVKEIFTSKANFTKITDEKLVVNKMTQKNVITIAEKGTIKSKLKQTETQTINEDEFVDKIILNRPYAYLIINNETNDVLFIGKVVRVNESS